MRKALIGFGSTLILLSAVSAGPAAAAPTKAVKCGDTVATTARLTRDLRCGSLGVTMMPGATLDLNHHRLIGAGRDSGGQAIALDFNEVYITPITVKNGSITGWHQVLVTDVTNVHADVSDVTFSANGYVIIGPSLMLTVKHSRFLNNTHAASNWEGGLITVSNSAFVGNGLALDTSEGRIEASSTVFRNNVTAVTTSLGESDLRGNTFTGNGTAYRSDMVTPFFDGMYETLIDNRFIGNDVAVNIGVGAYLKGNVFQRNTTALTSVSAGSPCEVKILVMEQNTFTRNGSAVYTDAPASLKDTVAIRNRGYGIYAPRATDLGGNVAYGNGTQPQCTGVCSGRPRPGPTPSRRS